MLFWEHEEFLTTNYGVYVFIDTIARYVYIDEKNFILYDNNDMLQSQVFAPWRGVPT